jgi:hypothetical protein
LGAKTRPVITGKFSGSDCPNPSDESPSLPHPVVPRSNAPARAIAVSTVIEFRNFIRLLAPYTCSPFFFYRASAIVKAIALPPPRLGCRELLGTAEKSLHFSRCSVIASFPITFPRK